MHLCLLTGEYPPFPHGGVGAYIQTMGRALVEQGHDVTVVGIYHTLNVKQIDEDAGVCVIRLPSARRRFLRLDMVMDNLHLGAEIHRIHQNNPIDILEGAELSFGLLPPLPPVIKVIRLHGGHHFFSVTLGKRPRLFRKWTERLSFARADAYCAVSKYVGNTTAELIHKKLNPLAVIGNPVDTMVFTPVESASEQSGLIVFVGTIVRKKGVFELVSAMKRIVDAIPNACLWLIGRDKENTVAQLKAQVPAELQSRIIFYGAAEHDTLPALMTQAQVCVFPSYMEAQGIVVLEGMAMGKAVVASKTGPGPELIEDGVTGLLCDPYDPDSIADQVITILTDENLRRRLGEAARQEAVSRFSLETIIKMNEDFYYSLLNAGKT